MIKEIITFFVAISALTFGYRLFMWWLRWFENNYEIRHKNDK